MVNNNVLQAVIFLTAEDPKSTKNCLNCLVLFCVILTILLFLYIKHTLYNFNEFCIIEFHSWVLPIYGL